jgi:hypothetical protein
MKRTFLTFAAALILATGVASANNVSRFGINIISCTVATDGNGNTKGVDVSYVNSAPVPAIQVNFLVRYHGQGGVVIDKGSFTQGAEITHTLTNSFMGYSYQGPNPGLCRVNKVVRADGSVQQ